MPISIYRDDVGRLLEDGAQLVEVLPAAEYDEEYLPGAINIPLKELNRETTARLRRDTPVIVYCHDYQWDMSPRAAWRLEGIGFTQVFDYVAGKADWLASGLPREGKLASVTTIGDAARKDVPTCGLDDDVGEAYDRAKKSGWKACVVVNDERVVLGLLRNEELESDPNMTVERVMRSGPATFRPDAPVGKMAERMRKRGATTILVTTPDGKLVGLLYRGDAERLAGEGLGAAK